MNDGRSKPNREIKILKQQIVDLETREATHKRSEFLLLAFNQASLSMSMATTPEEIFETVTDTLKGLGISSIIYSTAPDGQHLIINSISLDPQALRVVEKITGTSTLGYTISIDSIDAFRQSIHERRTLLTQDPVGILQQVTPTRLNKYRQKITSLVDIPQSINAPLICGDEVIGLLSVQSKELVEEDIPLITIFAQQLASSWQRSKLLQQIQPEIDERVQVESELIREDNRAQKFLDFAKGVIVVLDKHGNIELINQKGCDILDYEEEELIGENWFEKITPESEREQVFTTFNQLIQGDIDPVEYLEYSVLPKSGGQRTIAWHNTLLINEEGVITGILSSGEDITDQVLAEIAIRESKEKFRTILQSSPMGMHIYTLEPDGSLIFTGNNPAADDILWVDNSQFIGKTIEEAFPGLAETEIPDSYRRVAAQGEPWHAAEISYEDQWISGVFEVYAVQLSPGKMAAIFIDIKDRKHALEEQERLVNILETTSDVVGTATLTGKLVYLNKAGRRMFGLKDDENLRYIDRIQNQPIDEYLKIQQESIDAALLYGIWSGESVIIDPSNQEIPVSIVLITHRDKEQNPEFISAVIRDISDRQQAKELIQLQSTALDSAATGVFITDNKGMIIWANPAVSEITGYALEEIIGKTPEMFSSDQQAKDDSKKVSDLFSKGVVWQGELTNLRKDGETYISEQTITPVFDPHGRVTHYISIQQDITKRKENETALKQRATQLALLNDIGEQIVAVLDLEQVFQQAVKLVHESFGYHHVGIFTLDPQGEFVVMRASSGGFNDLFPTAHSLKIGQGLVGWVAQNNEAALSNDVASEEHFKNFYTEKLPTSSELSVPIHIGNQVIGVLDAQSPSLNAFDESDVTVMQTLADQIAIAIENARLHAAIKRSLEETQAMAAINQALNETLDLDRLLQLMVDSISQIIPHIERVVAHLYDEDNATLIPAAVAGMASQPGSHLQMQNGQGIAGEVIKTGHSINVRDTQNDSRFIPIKGASHLRSLLVVPIQSSGGRLGTISVSSKIPRVFTDEDERLLTMLGVQASIALQNARLYASTSRRLAESNMLFFISNRIVDSAEPDVEDILHQVVDRLWQDFGYYHVHVYLIDQESGALIANQGSGPIGAQLKDEEYQFRSEEGIVGYAASVGEAFMTNNVDDVLFFRKNPILPNTSAELAAPLRARDQILGVLDILHQPPNTFDDDDFRFLITVADQIAVVLDKAMLYTELQQALENEQRTRAQLVQTEKLAAMGRLIASVAHELNNPLQAVQNALYLVKLEENLSPQAAEDLQVAIDEGSRMAGLIARLRDTYRPVDAADYQSESVDTLIEEVQKLLDTHLRHNNVRLEFTPNPKTPHAVLIRDQIKQVILNLCINAIESMPEGGKLTIYSTDFPESDEIQINVSDTGPGISPEVQNRIFEPFFTTKEGGTGLGLAVSYEIAQNHGGNITAVNNKGPGCTFTLSLPYKNNMLE
jgi:PAS domain S-box-containing protein